MYTNSQNMTLQIMLKLWYYSLIYDRMNNKIFFVSRYSTLQQISSKMYLFWSVVSLNELLKLLSRNSCFDIFPTLGNSIFVLCVGYLSTHFLIIYLTNN